MKTEDFQPEADWTFLRPVVLRHFCSALFCWVLNVLSLVSGITFFDKQDYGVAVIVFLGNGCVSPNIPLTFGDLQLDKI